MKTRYLKDWRPRIKASIRERVRAIADGRTLEAMAEKLIERQLEIDKAQAKALGNLLLQNEGKN